MMKAILQVGQVSKITGAIILVVGFIFYFQFELTMKAEADILYWLPNMGGLALVFFGLAIDEKSSKVRNLIYFSVSSFFATLAVVYLIDKYLDLFINVNEVILTLIICTILSLLYLLKLSKR